ncbi:MAG: glycoside hydrolase family 5 protein [Chloroflexi bacterium]|nr:glycoside hydrolase family 5 protein [Chloroflexota bacterium]
MARKRRVRVFIITGLILLGIIASTHLLSATEALRHTSADQAIQWAGIPQLSASGSTALYLPNVLRNFPPPLPVFGIQLTSIDASGGLNQIVTAKAYWVGSSVSWSAVESSPGTRYWAALASQEQQWINAANNGLTPIINIRSTPAWAQVYQGYSCGPMTTATFGNFATFMHDLVARYSQPPYNIKYWEIWNEPDVDHSLVPPDSPFGCWGNSSDRLYYGGSYYAQMLKVVYPQIKAADPLAQVLVGGLLLDCDPRGPCTSVSHASSQATESNKDPHVADAIRNDPLPPMFFEGILQGGGGPFFDGVSFHAYDYYQGALGQYYNPNWNSAWNTTGPVVGAKAVFIKSILAKYGVTGKFLMNTEMGLIDYGAADSNFEATKAYYVAQGYSAAIAQGLRANSWYSLYGWTNSGLLDSGGSPLPAYNAFKFAASELENAQSGRTITPASGVTGYEVTLPDRRIWVIWSLDGAPHAVNLPGVPLAIYHVDGTPVGPSPVLTVTLEPIYIEWSP